MSHLPERFDPAEGRQYLRKSARPALVAALLWVSLLVGFSCSSNSAPMCGPGQPCNCAGEYECYLGCYADNCQLNCSNTEYACGSVCGNGCQAGCHDTKRCSHSCEDGCQLDCHNTEECSGLCGAGCQYSCHDTQTCGVRVGPNSTVDCRNMEHCAVECEGNCTVTCTSVQDCDVTCLASPQSFSHDNDTYSCMGNP